MPEWLEILLKVGPLLLGFGVGILQLYLSDRFAKFKEQMDMKLEGLENKIEAKYPARDIIDLLVNGLKDRITRLEDQTGHSTPSRGRR